MANFKELSRYTNTIAEKNRSNQYFIPLRSKLNIKQREDDIFITVTKEVVNRPDLISFKVYSTPDLWWAIYDFNNISDPLFELKEGQVLRIPSLERLLNILNNLV